MALLLSSAALVAYRRGDRSVGSLVAVANRARTPVLTSAACVAEAWEAADGSGGVLGRLLEGVRQEPLDARGATAAAELCEEADMGGTDLAHLALLARHHDKVVVDDVEGMERLLRTRGTGAQVLACPGAGFK